MNEMKKNLKLFTLLVALFAGNVIFTAVHEFDQPTFNPESAHEDPAAQRERKAREEQDKIKREQEAVTKTISQRFNAGMDAGIKTLNDIRAKGVGRSIQEAFGFKTPESVRRSTGEAEDSGIPLVTPHEATVSDSGFVHVEAPRLTITEIQNLTPDDVNKLTQNDIRDLGTDIVHLSPKAFKSLSKAQTLALSDDQLSEIFFNQTHIPDLKVESINPSSLARALAKNAFSGKFSDDFVNRMTNDQIEALLEDSRVQLNTYFTPEQLARMKSNVSWAGKISRKAQAVANWLSSAGPLKWLKDISNKNEAVRMVKEKANNKFDLREQKNFRTHIDQLRTIKDVRDVADAWTTTRLAKVKEIENKIDTLKKSSLPNNEKSKQIDALRKSLQSEIKTTNEQIFVFTKELQDALRPNEVAIPMESKGNPGDTKIEIIDMLNIDPTKSIEEQFSTLNSARVVIHITDEKELLNHYSSWISKQISKQLNITTQTSITDQLNEQMEKITGKPWAEINPSIKDAIVTKLAQEVQEKYNKEVQKEIQEKLDLEKHEATVSDAGAMFKRAEEKAEEEAMLRKLEATMNEM